MTETPISLLHRLKQAADLQAWNEFVELLTPVLVGWSRRTSMSEADTADWLQDVFMVLLHQMPNFEYDPNRSFRGWLKTIAMNKFRERLRVTRPTVPLTTDLAAESEEHWDEDYRRYLVNQAMDLVRPEFDLRIWQIFWLTSVEGLAGVEVATRLNISPGAVYVARHRVILRIREKISDLID